MNRRSIQSSTIRKRGWHDASMAFRLAFTLFVMGGAAVLSLMPIPDPPGCGWRCTAISALLMALLWSVSALAMWSVWLEPER